MSQPVDDEDSSLLLIVLDASSGFWTKREAIRRRQEQVQTPHDSKVQLEVQTPPRVLGLENIVSPLECPGWDLRTHVRLDLDALILNYRAVRIVVSFAHHEDVRYYFEVLRHYVLLSKNT